MRLFIICFLLIGLSSCKTKEPLKPRKLSSLEIETLMQDSLLNVRALEIDSSGTGIFATSLGEVGFIYASSGLNLDYVQEEKLVSVIYFGYNFSKDSIPNFRSVAKIKNKFFAVSIGNPAVIASISKIDDIDFPEFVYEEHHPKAFYDSIDFWNDQEGIAIGDPTEDCMSVIITRDGGKTWTKLSCDNLPEIKEGEAAFAASDTNIAIVGDHTWVATGGKTSRILYSPNKGKTWTVYDTPIIQGKETTGIYSIHFYDEKNGFAIGGDYTKPNDTLNNKIRTNDGGKTWKVVANGKGPGYRSCVQYVPNSNGKELVAIGFKGIDYSSDAGESWQHLSDEGFYTIRFLNDSIAYAAGKGRISKLTFRE